MSSLTNFAVSIYVVHTLGAVQFGAFSLAYVTYAFALNASRGLATDPLMVRFSGTDLPTWRRAVADCTGTAVVVGLVTGACVLVAAALLNGSTSAAFLALGLTLPGLMLQDSWRYSFFALGRGGQAFLNDTIWAAALLPALVFLRMAGHASVFWFVLAWGAAAAVAAAAGPLQARVVPKLFGAWRWLSTHRDLGPRYFAEGTSSSAATQLRTYSIGLILGLAAVGYVQAATTLMGPVTIMFLGMSLVTIPEAARVLRRSPRHLPLFCVIVCGGLTLVALAWGLFLLVAVPRGLGNLILGPIWRSTYPLVLPMMLFVVGQGLSGGAGTGLHALGASRRSLRAMVLGSIAYVIGALVGAVEGGAVGTVVGSAVAAWIGAVLWWWQLRVALRESDQIPPGQRLWSSRPAGRHRIVPTPAFTPSLDLTIPLDPVPKAAAFASAPDFARRRAGQHPRDRVATRQSAQRGPAKPTRRATKPEVAARAFLVAGVLAASAATGWFLVYESSETGGVVGTQVPATATAGAHMPIGVRDPRAATARELQPVGAASFDPHGGGRGEDNRLARLAIDANPATAWHTARYASARFGSLKSGTGLLLDMGRKVTITGAQLTLGSAPGADFQLRVGAAATSLRDLRPVAHVKDAGGQVYLRLNRPARGRYVLIWFTRLPPDASGTFQASVYNVRLQGRL